MSNYTPRSVKLLEGSDKFSLPVHLEIKYQTYKRTLYGTWPSSPPVPDVGTEFSFCGNNFMISKSKINDANLGLFILSHVIVPLKKSVSLMLVCGLSIVDLITLNIVKCKHRIFMYSMCMNGYDSRKFNMKDML